MTLRNTVGYPLKAVIDLEKMGEVISIAGYRCNESCKDFYYTLAFGCECKYFWPRETISVERGNFCRFYKEKKVWEQFINMLCDNKKE